jgi:alpha/beta superfamily hydrolase
VTDDIARLDVHPVTSDDVTLEGEAALPTEPRAGVVLTHPHPLHGGDMRSIVPSELFRLLPGHDIAALRFNFRGVGRSAGAHGHGVDEAHDLVAAIDALEGLAPEVPLVVCGWSFGADVALRVTDARLAGWFLVAATFHVVRPDEMAAATDPRPKRFAQPEHDQFRDPASARTIIADWPNARLDVITGADHFCVGRTDRIAELLLAFLVDLEA